MKETSNYNNKTSYKASDTLKSVEKALLILEAFNINNYELSVTEISQKLSLPKVSIYRFLRVFLKRGFIIQDPQTKKYRLGIKIFELGSLVLRNMELRKAAFPLIEELSKHSGETVHLGVKDGNEFPLVKGSAFILLA